MHRHHIPLRQQEVQHGEDRLLHFAGVGGAADQHDLAGEVAGDHRLGAAAVADRVALEARQVDDGHCRHEGFKLAAVWANQQVSDEQRMPGEFGIDAHVDPLVVVRAAAKILGEKLHSPGVFNHVGVERLESVLAHFAVIVPPDRMVGGRVAHDEFVLGRASRVGAGVDRKRAAGGDSAFAASDCIFVKFGLAGVEMNAGQFLEACRIRADGRVPNAFFYHDPASPLLFGRLACVSTRLR